MKNRIVLFSLLALVSLIGKAQTVTYDVSVDRQMKSSSGNCNILAALGDDEITCFLWECITARGQYSRLMMSSSTILTSPQLSEPLHITSWGIMLDDEVHELNLDEKYDVEPDRRYILVMLFPGFPKNVREVNISTNTGKKNDLVWKGIHLKATENDYSSGSSSSEERKGNSVTFDAADLFGSSSSDSFEASGSGSGFAVSEDGLIATCYHVVSEARAIRVRGINGDFEKTYAARVIAQDRNNDLALLQITDDDFGSIKGIPYQFLDRNAEVGEDVFALGYPLRALMGDEIKLTNGIVSSKSGYQGDITSYQISVAVQPGNSGCPLFDRDGRIVGIVNARLAVESAAYAVKSPYLKTLATSSDLTLNTPTVNALAGKTLSELAKSLKHYVYIIEVE